MVHFVHIFLAALENVVTRGYLERNRTSTMELFAKIVNGFLTIFAKSYIVDI